MADETEKLFTINTGAVLTAQDLVFDSSKFVYTNTGLLLGPPDADRYNRTVFVGYPYSFPKDDYRGAFAEVGAEYDMTFIFADEEITNQHILEKISGMMARTAFSLFDVTTWNPKWRSNSESLTATGSTTTSCSTQRRVPKTCFPM
jgi:hypothetical protein